MTLATISHLSDWKKFKMFTVHSVGKAVGKQALPDTPSGNAKWYNPMQRNWAISH